MGSSDQRDSASPFGVLAFLPWNHIWNLHHFEEKHVDEAARIMKEACIGFVRMDFLWSDLEPSEDRFDFARYDRIVNRVMEQGVKILAVLNYNAAWQGASWNQAPDPKLFCRYVQATVRHFKDRVRYWEIWNEPDHPNYWQPQDNLQGYSRLLKAVYPVLKSEDPTAEVLMGGLSQALPAHLRLLYEQAGACSFDIVNTHPFVNPIGPSALTALGEHYAAVRLVMAEFNDLKKPIWFTELGCPGVPWMKRSAQASTWWLGESPSEDQQADWVKTIYENVLKWPAVEKIFWAFFRDTPHHFQDGVDYFGLVREDFSKKPAFHALKKIPK